MASLAVDLVPWLVKDHREVTSHIVCQCDSVTLLAYRDRATGILAEQMGCLLFAGRWAPAAESVSRHSHRLRPYRQHDVRRRRRGGDAQGAQRCRRTGSAAAVRRVRRSSPRLVADDAGEGYSRPADTQLMSVEPVAGHRICGGIQRGDLIRVSVTDNDPRFSSTRAARRVPGIGTDATPNASARYRNHANATWAAVAPAASATDVTTSTTARFASSAPSANRGMVLRKSLAD